MASILEVEKVVPASLKISYQNLFSCRYETATKDGEPGPELNAKYAVDVLEAVKKDPAAGDKCLNALRAEPEKK
ncbi:hypothetical protein [Sphingomonas sp. 3-13AW]|uniref:hypothetical protein n=1 Tax=Sphingomonas sp. 3-13AW TaxID=3050450 RepID=UPI003BB5F8C5